MKKTSQEEFEKRCREIYGERFTFEKAVYKNNRTKISLYDTINQEYIDVFPENVYRGKIRTKNNRFTTENFIKKSKEIFGDSFTYEKTICNNAYDNVTITCKKHGDFNKKAYAHINGKQGCPLCSDNFRTKKMIIDEASKIFGEEYDYSLVNDAYPNEKIKIICKKHGIFEKTPYEHLSKKSGCPLCSLEKKKKKIEDFIKDSNINERKINIIGQYDSMTKPLEFQCGVCGYKWKTTPTKIQCGEGCPKCSKSIRPTNDEFIAKASYIHGNKYDYSLCDISKATQEDNNKVRIICPKHGPFMQSYHLHLNGGGCPYCSESSIEEKTRLMLERNSINYIQYWKHEKLRNKLPLSIDFYLPDINVAIECQGEQHFKPITSFGGIEVYEKQHKNDILKHSFCKDNNIKLLYYAETKHDTFLNEKIFKTVEGLLSEIKSSIKS